MSEPIFSVLSGKFSSGFTVSGFTGDNVSLNGTYNLMGNNPNRGPCNYSCYFDGTCPSGGTEENDCLSAESDYFTANSSGGYFYYAGPGGPWEFMDTGGSVYISNPTTPILPGYENFPTTGWIGPNGETLTFS